MLSAVESMNSTRERSSTTAAASSESPASIAPRSAWLVSTPNSPTGWTMRPRASSTSANPAGWGFGIGEADHRTVRWTRDSEQVRGGQCVLMTVTRFPAVLIALFLLVAGSARAATMTEQPDVTIPASDGVNLVGDVYLPGDGKARYPAVIDMEPYGRSTSTDYVPEGYARINTDVRGSGKSGGALCLLCLREQQDGSDAVGWGAQQPGGGGDAGLCGS